MTATLQKAFEKAASMPESQQEAFAQFLLEELEFLTAVDEGIRAVDQGEIVGIEEMRKRVAQWASESSSQSRQ